jgi:hypothetical protein
MQVAKIHDPPITKQDNEITLVLDHETLVPVDQSVMCLLYLGAGTLLLWSLFDWAANDSAQAHHGFETNPKLVIVTCPWFAGNICCLYAGIMETLVASSQHIF